METVREIFENKIPARFVFHEDAGHGWLEVPYSTIVELKINDKITKYSYRKGDTVFLEEDCDASLFIRTYLSHIGKDPRDYAFFRTLCVCVYDGDSSPIRNHDRYN